MKRLLIFIIIFIFQIHTYVFSSLLEYFNNTRVNYNYLGSIYNQDNILIYGDAGIVLKFDYDLNFSKKIILDDRFNIVSMTNVNNKIFGVFNKEYIFKTKKIINRQYAI